MLLKMKFCTILLFLTAVVIADDDRIFHKFTKGDYGVFGCKYSLFKTATFCAKDTAKSYKCQCVNKAARASMAFCLRDALGEKDYLSGYSSFERQCRLLDLNVTDAVMDASYNNATKHIVNTTQVEGFNKTAVIDYPIYYNKKLYHYAYESNRVRYTNIEAGEWMGAGLMGYWALLVLIAATVNFLQRIGFISKYFTSTLSNKFRRYISLPSLTANRKHSQAVKIFNIAVGFFPTRLESLILFGHFALFFIFCGVRYEYVKHDTIWATEEGQRSRYPGDRVGILSLYGLLLSFLFAGRNNFLIWVTGWKQSTFLTFHKWISRITFIGVLIHAGSMERQGRGIGKLHSRLAAFWYRWGIVAVSMMGGAILFAGYGMRKSYYEVFLISHIVFIAISLVGIWIHTKQQGYQNFAYTLAAIWCFDRFVRLVRLAYFGIRTAKVSIVSDEVLKVVVPRHKLWKSFPGSFGFVHFLKPTTFHQNHPFTVIETDEDEVTFLVKIKGGVTTQIHKYLKTQPNQTGEIRVTIEGPYGTRSDIKRYDSVVMYSGGTGIAGPYGHALENVRKGKQQHMKLYWVIRNWHSVDWIYDELVKLKDSPVEVIIYVTNPNSGAGARFQSVKGSSSEDSLKDENDEQFEKTAVEKIACSLDFVEFRYGRPDIEELVKSDIQECDGKTLAIVTAAHNALVDDVRYSVSKYLDLNSARTDYFEELQTW